MGDLSRGRRRESRRRRWRTAARLPRPHRYLLAGESRRESEMCPRAVKGFASSRDRESKYDRSRAAFGRRLAACRHRSLQAVSAVPRRRYWDRGDRGGRRCGEARARVHTHRRRDSTPNVLRQPASSTPGTPASKTAEIRRERAVAGGSRRRIATARACETRNVETPRRSWPAPWTIVDGNIVGTRRDKANRRQCNRSRALGQHDLTAPLCV